MAGTAANNGEGSRDSHPVVDLEVRVAIRQDLRVVIVTARRIWTRVGCGVQDNLGRVKCHHCQCRVASHSHLRTAVSQVESKNRLWSSSTYFCALGAARDEGDA